MRSIVEPRVRRLVTEHLGVAEEELLPELSLADDLAADSLDFAELAIAAEEELDLRIPEDVLVAVRTFGDLIDALAMLARARLEHEAPRVPVVARVRRPSAGVETTLERTGLLTPYFAETLADDVLRCGPGTRIDVLVSGAAEERALQHVREALAWLADRGVQVMVQRERHGGGRHQPSAA
jgi:acyl carrier protein